MGASQNCNYWIILLNASNLKMKTETDRRILPIGLVTNDLFFYANLTEAGNDIF